MMFDAGCLQGLDIGRKLVFADRRRGELQVGPWCDVVNVLEHRAAFVRRRRRIVLDDVDGVGRVEIAGPVRF